MPRGIVIGFVLGLLLGGAGGAVLGAHIASWTGGLVGGYGGIICGTCLLGGLGGVVSREADDLDRGEAILSLVFGVVATAGSVAGYRIGTLGLPRVSPMPTFFVGLVVPGAIAGLIAAKLLADRAEPAILGLLVFGPAGAGTGAWLGNSIGSPVAIAIGLVIGSVLGASMGHLINVSIERAIYGPDDPVARHHGDYPRR